MSFNPLSEVRYRYRLAMEHLKRAERLFSLRDWVGTTSSAQLAVENFAKAVIAVFEVPRSIDRSNISRLKSGDFEVGFPST
jgi:HEPN domain-containing protein